MKFFSKLGRNKIVPLVLLVAGIACAVVYAATEMQQVWPPTVGTSLEMKISIPGEGYVWFSPTVWNTDSLKAAYDNPEIAQQKIQVQIQAAYITFMQDPYIAGIKFEENFKQEPLKEHVYPAMIFSHLSFPGLQYGHGTIQ